MKMKFNEVELEVTPTGDHRQWFMTAEEVAKGYGVIRQTVTMHLKNHEEEFREGIEKGLNIIETLGGPQTTLVIYREGVIKMGFFTRSRKSADFRQWATNIVMLHMDGQNSDLKNMFVSMRSHMDSRFTTLENRMNGIQDEVDELRGLVGILWTDQDADEIRELIHQVKSETGEDGRAIAGRVRATLGTSGLYNTADARQVKNVIRNMLGFGVMGTVP